MTITTVLPLRDARSLRLIYLRSYIHCHCRIHSELIHIQHAVGHVATRLYETVQTEKKCCEIFSLLDVRYAIFFPNHTMNIKEEQQF